jgi:TPP-dependent pyruvate/acetoin dehydrogenase alpha subunit
MKLDVEKRRWMYQQMLRSRTFEERMLPFYMEGKAPTFDWAAGPLPGEMHLSMGQEAVGAGLCAALRPEDWVHTAHRPHHVAIPRGIDLKKMAAEIFGKATGLSGGRGGHMHLYDARVNFMSSGIVGEQLGSAAGLAFTCKVKQTGGIAVAVIGEGAANQGAFHEVLNLAGLYKLPLLCVIEDNNWAVATRKSASTAIPRNSDRASAYGIRGVHVVGNDPDTIYEAILQAAELARLQNMPSLIEIETFRFKGHFFPDPSDYIPKSEKESWTDCVLLYRAKLLASGAASEEQLAAIEQKVGVEIDSALEFASQSAYPEPVSALEGVFANGLGRTANEEVRL